MTRGTLIRRNLTRKPLRTTLTLIAVLTAFLLFGLLKTVETALNSGSDLAAADRLVVINKVNFTQPLPISYIDRIRKVDWVKAITWADWIGAYWRDEREVFVAFAVDPESYLAVYPELKVGDEDRERWLADRQGALIGRKLAERYGWKVGDRIPIRSQIWIRQDTGEKTWEVNIDGIFDADDPRIDTGYMLMHWTYLNEGRSFARDTFGWAIIRTTGAEVNERVAREIDRMFENSPFRTRTDTEAAFSKAFLEMFGDIGLIITSVVGAAMFTILMIAGTTMMLAVRERTREIAVLRTLGFRPDEVFRMVLWEAAVIAFGGGLAGMAVSAGFVKGASEALGQYLPPLVISGGIWGEAVLWMLALALLTGLPPAWTAMRVKIVEGLSWRNL